MSTKETNVPMDFPMDFDTTLVESPSDVLNLDLFNFTPPSPAKCPNSKPLLFHSEQNKSRSQTSYCSVFTTAALLPLHPMTVEDTGAQSAQSRGG